MATNTYHSRRARSLRRQGFSLLEVLLALAVIAFGLVSIMALLPASVKSGRDSVSETHSSQAASHLIQVLSSRMEAASTQDAWDAAALVLPAAKPGVDEPEEGWTLWLSQSGMRYWLAGDNSEFYRLDMRRSEGDSPEFTAVCRVWRDQVTISQYDAGAWSTRTMDWGDAIALNVEISWPARMPYVRRDKALYALNVFRTLD